MRRYETIFILDPDVSEEQRGGVFGRLDELVDQKNGFQIETDEWGVRKLAYPIKKRPRGEYVRVEYCGEGMLVDEIERFFRIDDRILKYMTVVLDKDVDLEKVKQEIEEAKAKAAEAEKDAQQVAESAPVSDEEKPVDAQAEEAEEAAEASESKDADSGDSQRSDEKEES